MKNRLANQRIVISNQKVFLKVPSLFFLTKTLIFNASFSSSARALDKETNIDEFFIQADNLWIDMLGVLSAGIFYIIGNGFKSSWTQQWISRYDIDDELTLRPDLHWSSIPIYKHLCTLMVNHDFQLRMMRGV